MTRRLALAPQFTDAPEELPSKPPAAEASPAIILVPHSAISRSPLNPRKTFDQAALEELADSIAARGLMQNLVVRPAGENRYEIVAGERRWRAIGILVARGTKPADTPVPILVKDVSDLDLLLSALQENLERRDMHPLEEAEAFLAATKLSQRGDGATADIAERFTKTQRWVQQRIALASRLDPSVKKAFGQGELTLEQAKAFLAGSLADQKKVLAALRRGLHPSQAFNDVEADDIDDYGDDEDLEDDPPPATAPDAGPQPIRFSANDVRSALARNLIPVAAAIFPLEQYTGGFNGEDDDPARRYFADTKAATKLQEAALEERVGALRETHSEVRVLRGAERHSVDLWRYREAKKKDKETIAFVLVSSHTLAVEIREQLVLNEAYARHGSPDRQTKDGEPAPQEPCLKSLLAEAHRRKTATLQDAIAADSTLAIRVACLQLLAQTTDAAHLVRAERPRQEDYVVGPKIQALLSSFVESLPRGTFDFYNPADRQEAPYISHDEKKSLAIWRALEQLAPAALGKLHAALVAAHVRVFNYFDPKLGDDPVALALAAAAGVEHAAAHTVDEDWLKGYRKPRLVAIAKTSGAVAGDKAAVAAFEALTSTGMRAEILGSKTRERSFVPPELYFGSAKELEQRAAGKLVPIPGEVGKPAHRDGARAKTTTAKKQAKRGQGSRKKAPG